MTLGFLKFLAAPLLITSALHGATITFDVPFTLTNDVTPNGFGPFGSGTVTPHGGILQFPQFDPSFGNLTAISFSMASSLNQVTEGLGTPTVKTIDGIGSFPYCDSVTQTVTPTISGALTAGFPLSVIFTGNPLQCVGTTTYAAVLNIHDRPGSGPLSDYIGPGFVPIYLSLPGTREGFWRGTITGTYTYNTDPPTSPSSVPEPAAALLCAAGISLLAAHRFARRR